MNPRPLLLLLPLLLLGCPKKSEPASSGAAVADQAMGAASRAEAHGVWAEMIARSDAFDPKVFDLYSSDAILKERRHDRDGSVTERTFLVAAFRPLAKRIMEAAKVSGDGATYTDVVVSQDGTRWRITANRYSTVKCTTDTEYYALMAKRESRWEVAEEFQVTHVKSQCPSDPEEARRMIGQVLTEMDGQLPKDLDGHTRLDAVEGADLSLTYRQTLTQVASSDPNLEPMKSQMYADARRQACGLTDQKQILHHGGSITYVINTSDGKKAIEVTTVEADCQ